MKKFIAVLIVFSLFICRSQAQNGNWYDEDGGLIFPGFGTKHNPYEISSASALTFLADQVNRTSGKSFEGSYFVLTDDIDLSEHYWIPIGGDPLRPFRGYFNGNGKTIYNLYVRSTEIKSYPASGLFGYIGNGAIIENLNLEGGEVAGCNDQEISRTGALAGYLLCSVAGGVDSILIRNCHNRNVVVTGGKTDYSNTGGLIGEGYAFCDSDGEVLIRIEDCSNEGMVSASTSNFPYTGGIIGKGRGHGYCFGSISAHGTLLIRSCINRGMIVGGKTSGVDAVSSTGGIFGFGYASGDGYGDSDGSGVFTIERCSNTGSVKGGEATGEAHTYTGGLFGYGDGYGYGDTSGSNESSETGHGYGSGIFTINSCMNRGAVAGGEAQDPETVASTGGIFGFASGSGAGNKQGQGYAYGSFMMVNCYSYADISAAKGYIGGLGGWIATSGNGPNYVITAIVQDCYVAGTINADISETETITGGIIGRIHRSDDANKDPHIDRCLAALSYIKGTPERTFRIAGQLLDVDSSAGVLTDNYAYVQEGQWNKRRVRQNGLDWSKAMAELPVSDWNTSERAWVIDRRSEYLPRLRYIAHQSNIPVP